MHPSKKFIIGMTLAATAMISSPPAAHSMTPSDKTPQIIGPRPNQGEIIYYTSELESSIANTLKKMDSLLTQKIIKLIKDVVDFSQYEDLNSPENKSLAQTHEGRAQVVLGHKINYLLSLPGADNNQFVSTLIDDFKKAQKSPSFMAESMDVSIQLANDLIGTEANLWRTYYDFSLKNAKRQTEELLRFQKETAEQMDGLTQEQQKKADKYLSAIRTKSRSLDNQLAVFSKDMEQLYKSLSRASAINTSRATDKKPYLNEIQEVLKKAGALPDFILELEGRINEIQALLKLYRPVITPKGISQNTKAVTDSINADNEKRYKEYDKMIRKFRLAIESTKSDLKAYGNTVASLNDSIGQIESEEADAIEIKKAKIAAIQKSLSAVSANIRDVKRLQAEVQETHRSLVNQLTKTVKLSSEQVLYSLYQAMVDAEVQILMLNEDVQKNHSEYVRALIAKQVQ